MAILSNLLSVKEPSGFWITIIKAFESGMGSYILAIILLTIVIRLILSVFDTANKFNTQNMTAMQSKMQPELEKINKKYANQPQLLQQKQNELQRKYMGKNYFGSCGIMLVVMILNMVILFTLFAGLNTMSSYKNSVSYDNIKYTYANCLNVTDAFIEDVDGKFDLVAEFDTKEERQAVFADYEKLSIVIRNQNYIPEGGAEELTKKVVDLVYTNEGVDNTLYTVDFKDEKAFTTTEVIPAENPEDEDKEIEVTNKNIIALIQKYIPVYEEGEEQGSKEVVIGQYDVEGENGIEQKNLYLSDAVQAMAMKEVVKVYDNTKESFLWIENIWIADSPLNQSIVSYSTLESQIGKKNLEEGEKTIYDAFMLDLRDARSKANGYFIIPILVVAVAVLSTYLTNYYNRRKNAKKGLPPVKQNAKWVSIIIPALLGIFALFYNSVFAIYLLTGQIVNTALLVPELMIVDHFIDKKNKKQEEKTTVTVDYARKF